RRCARAAWGSHTADRPQRRRCGSTAPRRGSRRSSRGRTALASARAGRADDPGLSPEQIYWCTSYAETRFGAARADALVARRSFEDHLEPLAVRQTEVEQERGEVRRRLRLAEAVHGGPHADEGRQDLELVLALVVERVLRPRPGRPVVELGRHG